MEHRYAQQHREQREHPCTGTDYTVMWEDLPRNRDQERIWIGVR